MSKPRTDACTGVLIVNKHEGVTSHRIVSACRKLFDTSRVGHTGTLDPIATGVLPVLLGRAAKASDYIMSEDKEYIAGMRLGITTDTEDITGTVITESDNIPSEADVKATAMSFVGKIMQVPPMYSAIKIDGRKLYDIAREGGEVERQAREIEIYSIECDKVEDTLYRLHVHCSKGTYIRTLCSDIGKKLGCGAVMASLERTRTGIFKLENAVTIAEIEEMTFEERKKILTPVDFLFEDLEIIRPNDFYVKLLTNGTPIYQKKIKTNVPEGTLVRIKHKNSDELIAVARAEETEEGSVLRPEKLFVLD